MGLEKIDGFSFSLERYLASKKRWLERIDLRKEYVVMDKIYCKACGRVKSVDMPERNFFINANCDCQERREAQERAAEKRIEQAKMFKELNERTLPAEVRGASFYGIFDKYSSQDYITICSRCEKFCTNFQAVKQSGRGIWLYGEYDTGKTYLAAAMLKSLQSEGVTVNFTTVGRIMEDLKATFGAGSTATEQSVMNLYCGVECLIIDGFTGIKSSKRGAESWQAERFCEIIRRRCDLNLPTVITCRRSIKELAADNLLPWEIVDRLTAKMVPFQLTEIQRKAKQEEIEF